MRRIIFTHTTTAAVMLLMFAAPSLHAQTTEELRRLSLEELGRIEITTVSRTGDRSSDVPAAIYVITRDDIRRAGVTSLAEAIALAPGVQASRIDANKTAVGIRGFADRLSKAMLVMIDGRAVYSPLFAGTYWEVQDTLLEDVDRIEVVRGPGGTLWGANAVTGIVNIITRSARETQGSFVQVAAGSEERGSAGVRYGGARGENLFYRGYAKVYDRDEGLARTPPAFDDSRMFQAGVRTDRTLSNGRSLTLQGDAYNADAGQRSFLTSYSAPYSQTVDDPAELWGANVLSRFTGPVGRASNVQVQAFYDRTSRREPTFEEQRHTVDLDVQQTLQSIPRHRMAWGFGYRLTSGATVPTVRTEFIPTDRTDHLFSGFLQDEWTLVPRRVRVTLGAKVEHNGYSGGEIQPSARVLWTPSASHTMFAAVSRAVRTPSRVETDMKLTSFLSASGPLFIQVQPNPQFVPESLVAYEAGYRVTVGQRLFATASVFTNHHDHVLSTEALPMFAEAEPAPPHVILPVTFANGLEGQSYGTELTADGRIAPWWRVTANYSFLRIDLHRKPGSQDVSQELRDESLSPHHQAQMQSSMDLPGRFDVDLRLKHASSLKTAVPAYTTATARLAWRANGQVEIFLVGKDLLSDHHLEFPGGAPGNVEVQRSVFAGFNWRPK